jgi:molybdate transport system substrate-binding protein
MKTTAMHALILLLGVAASSAGAAEIKAFVTIALESVMHDLGPKFEKASGHKLNAEYALGAGLAKRLQAGEAADVLLSPRGGVDALLKAGKLVPGSDAVLAQSGIGVAVRAGAPKPDISSPDALKRALLSARSVSYTNPAFGGASGVHFAKVLDRLGIAKEVEAKTRFPAEGGLTAKLLVSGDAELAIQQVGELISVPGVELVGPLPGDLQNITVFSAAIPATSSQADAARSLIRYLQTPEAAAVMKAKGLEPLVK